MKDNSKKPLLQILKELFAGSIIPILLSSAVMSATTYIYVHSHAEMVAFYSFFGLAFSAMIFCIYDVFRRIGKTWLTTIVVIVLANVCVVAGLRRIEEFGGFARWFMEPDVYSRIYHGRTVAVLLVLGIILVSCLYYFTRIRYRDVFVFLICMCPFCLFAKTFTDIPVIYPIIIMTLFFFIMTNRNSGGEDFADKNAAKGRYAAEGAFVIVVTIIASFMPKLEFAPYRENFDEFVTGVTISAAQAAADFTDFNDSSSDSTSNDDTTIVFYLRGDNPVLLKRQSFNLYDRSEHVWKYDEMDSSNGYSNWSSYTQFEDPTLLYDDMDYEGGETVSKECWVLPGEGNVRALYTPENMTDISAGNDDIRVFRTENDEYFISRNDTSKTRMFYIGWSDFEIDDRFSELFTDGLAEQLSEFSVTADSYIMAKEQAVKFYGKDYYGSSLAGSYSSEAAHSRVKALTEEIISGCENDHQKAYAIEQFFLKGDYIYDRDFSSYDADPDVFILNTKRGACAAYATAMTLMCREAGLTARYCEGFLVQRGGENNMWYTTTSDAHSFVQVWLDGYGWTNFNPTSTVTDGGYVDPTFTIVGITAAVIALIGIAAILLSPIIREKRFVRRVAKARGAEQYSLIYGKINKRVNSVLKKRTNTFTPTETAGKCSELFGYDISGFVEHYENAVYGGIESGEDMSGVYAGFTAAYKEKLKRDRKRGKKRK